MSDLKSLTERLEKVALRLEQAASRGQTLGQAASTGNTASSSSANDEGGNSKLDGFDEILNNSFADFVAKSNALGGDVATQVASVVQAFQAQRAFLENATKAKKPAQGDLVKLLAPTSTPLGEVQQFREQNRRSEQFNQLSAVSEGIPCLAWVTIAPKPAPYIKEMKDSAQFYTNRVISKDKGSPDAEWAKAWIEVIEQLYQFVKRVHTTGLTWNANGVEASSLSTAAPAAPKPAAPKAPAPAPAKQADADARGNLFAALSKGGAITSGLKKVEKSQMTHKNPELRASSVVPSAKPKATPKKTVAYGAAAKKHDPVFELQGKKWVVEYQKNNNDITIEATIKQTAYIYKCEHSTIRVTGKINSIILDGCKKVGLVFDAAVAAMEVINSQSVQVQVMESVPTVSIDKTDGCQVYLSATSLHTEIVSAKSSEMNVLFPHGPEGDFKEVAIAEQFKTVVRDGSLVTEATDINS